MHVEDYEVGVDIESGKYKTTGPSADSVIGFCYWARLNRLDGSLDSIIANENIKGQAVLVIQLKDKGVKFTGDCEWIKQ